MTTTPTPTHPEDLYRRKPPISAPPARLLDRIPPTWRTLPVGIAAGAVVLLVIVLTAVLATRPGSTPASQAQAPATTAPAVRTATVGQYAGIVNENAVDIRKTAGKFDDDECMLAGKGDTLCAIYALTLDAEAKTLVLSLTAAQKPGVPGFIGAPPDELAKLVADTISAADFVDRIADAGPSADLWQALNRLGDVLDRWQPYL